MSLEHRTEDRSDRRSSGDGGYITAERLVRYGVNVPISTRAEAIQNLKECASFLEEDELRVVEVKRSYARLLNEVQLIRDDSALQLRKREEAEKIAASLEEKVSLLKSELKAVQETGVRDLAQARREASYAVEQLDVSKAEVASAREAMEKAEEARKSAEEALEAARAEVAQLIEGRIGAQGPLLQAAVERVLFSDSFSAVAGELVKLASRPLVNEALVKASLDFPCLDPAKYAEPPMTDDELDRAYAWTLMKGISGSVILKELRSAPTLLTEEDIRSLPADKDARTEAMVADLRLNPPSEEEEEEDEEGDDEEEDRDRENDPNTGKEGANNEVPP